tara:strand:+ start:1038 stop:1280 length:243 start_codon:yes stop_codon:yes gene_type:complete
METVKLINKKGEIIERLKIQYEPNIKIWTQRGWELYEKKQKIEPKVKHQINPTQEKPKEKVEIKTPYSIPKDTPVKKKDK